MKILIIENNEDIQELLFLYLTDAFPEYQIDSALDGAIGLELMAKNKYCCIVTDMNMPHYTGIEVIKVCRSKDDITPFIVVTGGGGLSLANASIELGGVDFINKPINRERFVQAVRMSLRSRERLKISV